MKKNSKRLGGCKYQSIFAAAYQTRKAFELNDWKTPQNIQVKKSIKRFGGCKYQSIFAAAFQTRKVAYNRGWK